MAETSGDRATRIFISPQEYEEGNPQKSRNPPVASAKLRTQIPSKLHKNREKIHPPVPSSTAPSHAGRCEETVPLHKKPPWEKYKKLVTLLDLGGEVIVARRKGSLEMVGVKLVQQGLETETLQWLRKLRHPNIAIAIEVFSTASRLYVVYEEMHLPLEHIVRSAAFPSSKQIGTILGQTLDGLIYLESHGRTHISLSCDNVLLHRTGLVKLARYEMDAPDSSAKKCSGLQALSNITIRLMQKYVLEDDKVGIQNPELWEDSPIVSFLSSVTSAEKFQDLKGHLFLEQIWQKNSRWPVEALSDLIIIAECTVPRDYRWVQ